MDSESMIHFEVTREELNTLQKALRVYFNQQMKQANKYREATGDHPVLRKSTQAKALMRRVEAILVELEQEK